MRLRGWVAWAGAGCAGALAYRGDWRAAGGAAVCVLVLAAWWVRDEFAATRERMRAADEMFAEIARCQAARNHDLARPGGSSMSLRA